MTPASQASPPSRPSSLGLDPKVAATLAYLLGWVTGLFFLLLEREDRYVRFHAMQAVVGLGGLWLLASLLWMSAFGAMFVSAAVFQLLVVTGQIVALAGLIAWLVCLFKAYSGERWKLPVAGELAERLTGE